MCEDILTPEKEYPLPSVQSIQPGYVMVSSDTLFWLMDELNRYAARERGLLKVVETSVAELDAERQRSAKLQAQVKCMADVETRLRIRLVELQNRMEDQAGREENHTAEDRARLRRVI